MQHTRSVSAGRLSKAWLAAAALAVAANPSVADDLTVASFGFDVDAWCEAEADVFALDGDGLVYHFWRDGQELAEVRRIHVNPDIEYCAIGPHRVFLLDPAFGVVSVDRSPEAQPVVRPVFIQPPAGRGAFVPAQFELLEDPAGPVLLISGAGREMRLSPPPVPARAPAVTVQAATETDPVEEAGDAADDSVVLAGQGFAWIVGTDKQAGLRVYGLDGAQRAFLPVGKLNNVDALPLGGDRFLVAASNRTSIAIDLFEIEANPLKITPKQSIPVELGDPYGLCMAEIGGTPQVFIGDTEGLVEAWRLEDDGTASRVASYRFDSQTEGCVYDAEAGRLYVGEEIGGIWSVDPADGGMELLHAVDGVNLVADVEGLDIFDDGKNRYLLASSQGDDSFVIYRLPNHERMLKFRIGEDRERGIDGASETDGIAVTARALPGFPRGILVVQDGYNVAPGENQNFKVVDWRSIEALLEQD